MLRKAVRFKILGTYSFHCLKQPTNFTHARSQNDFLVNPENMATEEVVGSTLYCQIRNTQNRSTERFVLIKLSSVFRIKADLHKFEVNYLF